MKDLSSVEEYDGIKSEFDSISTTTQALNSSGKYNDIEDL